jgi:hypothetical protein
MTGGVAALMGVVRARDSMVAARVALVLAVSNVRSTQTP